MSLSKHERAASPAVVVFDEFELNAARNELRRAGQPIKVDALVMDLLVYLASRAGDLVTHEELIEHVWGGRAVSDNVVSVCVAKLRKALGHRRGERELVINVYGRGYRFMPAVREVLRSRTSEPPLPPSGVRRSGATFVGRDPIMQRLSSALDAALERRGRVCALLGEPGIGKTRIAEALEQHAVQHGVHVAWGRTRELEGAPPFWPWVDVVRTLLSAVSNEAAIAHLGPSYAELARVLPELNTPLEGGRDDALRFRTFEAVSRLLAFASQKTPWLLVLDDLHRADSASLELLSYLVDEIARLPVVIVATLRSTEPPRRPAEQRHIDYVLGHRNCERIEVVALAQRDVAAYTEAFLGRADDALSQAVFKKSEGNPFFMTELLRELGEAPASGEPSVPPKSASSAHELSLPAASLDLVRQRVRRVGDEVQPILKAAAVLGRSFELGLLSRVTEIPAATLLESLDNALATDFIVASPEDMGRFAFGHDLIRAVLYDGLPKLERAALHLRVAQVLAQLEREGRYVALAELAHHFLSAVPHGDAVHAAEQGERAAEAAMAVAAYADAAAILRRAHAALDLAKEPAPAVRCRLHYRMSVCLRVSDARESIQELRKTVAIARDNRLHDMLAMAGQAMVRAPGVVMIEDGRGVLEDALAGLPPDDHARLSTVLAHLAWCAPYSFDREQSEALAARALEHARAADSNAALLTAMRTHIYLSGGPCRPYAETNRLLEEADRLAAKEGGHTRALWNNQSAMLRVAFSLQQGDRAGLEASLVALGKSAHELQHAEVIWHYDRMRMVDRMNRGALADAGPQLRELRERGKSMQLFASDQVWGHDVLVLMRQTMELSTRSFALSSAAQPNPQDSPSVLALKLRSSLDMRRKDVAQPIFAEFAQRGFERLPCDRDYTGVMTHLAHAAIAFDERAHAEAIYALLAPHAALYSTDISMHTDGAIAHVLALLALHLGRIDDALSQLELAVRRNDMMELRARATESRIELASTLQRRNKSGDRTLARELLSQAESTARTLGLVPLLNRAIALARS